MSVCVRSKVSWFSVTLVCSLFAAVGVRAGLVDDFISDPLDTWVLADGPGAGFGSSIDQFGHDPESGALLAHYDSGEPTVRLQRSLGESWTEQDAFVWAAVLRIDGVEAPFDDFMQISFALTNSETTGSVRAGPTIDDANTFDNLELGYFPNDSAFGGFFVTGTAQGSAQGAPHAFVHFSSGSQSQQLPTETEMIWAGSYLPDEQILVYRVVGDGIDIEIEVDLTESLFGKPVEQFEVDTFAITSYFDGADFTPESVSLVADVSFGAVLAARAGDGDADGDVDLNDFGQFQLCYSGSDMPTTSLIDCLAMDFDADRDVDLLDFGAFQIAFTGAQ